MARTGRFLLDTNIVIALFAREAAVQQRLADASEVFVPSIILGELYYGARQSTRITENLARDARFLPLCRELRYTHGDWFISREEVSRCIQPPNPWALIGSVLPSASS